MNIFITEWSFSNKGLNKRVDLVGSIRRETASTNSESHKSQDHSRVKEQENYSDGYINGIKIFNLFSWFFTSSSKIFKNKLKYAK